MPPDQLFVAFLSIALLGTLIAGVLFRKRYRVCLSFLLYLCSVIVPSTLFAIWPGQYYNWENYLLKEIVHNLLKCAIAFELAYRTFRSFPGALATGRLVLLCIVIVIAVVTLTAPLPVRNPNDIDIEWHARMLNGTIWLFTGIAAVTLWYRLPIDPFHKAILVGFVPYLLVFSFGMRALVDLGREQSRLLTQYLHTFAYVALLAYWNRAAWARSPVQALAPRPDQAGQAEPA